jgi:hypothetical protein
MSKHDHKRKAPETAKFDASPLLVLMKTPLANDPPDVRNPDIDGLVVSRVATLHDPLTTELLAEVSRRSETLEIDDETIAEAKATTPAATGRSAPGKR